MTVAFKRYMVELARSHVGDLDNRDEMDDLWKRMTPEEQAVANDVAQVLSGDFSEE